MNRLTNEFIGSFVFVLVILISGGNPWAVGAALSIVVLIGGGAYNPAVSIAMSGLGKIQHKDLLLHIFAQVAGGLMAMEISKRVR